MSKQSVANSVESDSTQAVRERDYSEDTESVGLIVLIPTYNRAEVLRATLEDFTKLDDDGLRWRIVIIENNCTDHTAEVVNGMRQILPLTLLSENKPGKNSALNRALKDVALEEIVVFADDDISPETNWLREIMDSAQRWPKVAVFGGRIDIMWPQGMTPAWATADWIKTFGFSQHHYSVTEAIYNPPACPFGPNFWVRKCVFAKFPQFDETIGPNPKNRVMGSETSFLMCLQLHGVKMLHYPSARVKHRILEQECNIPALRRRGFTFGRGQVRLHGWRRKHLHERNRVVWGMVLVVDTVYVALRYFVGRLLPDKRNNCEMTVDAMIRLGSLNETWNGWRRKAGL